MSQEQRYVLISLTVKLFTDLKPHVRELPFLLNISEGDIYDVTRCVILIFLRMFMFIEYFVTVTVLVICSAK